MRKSKRGPSNRHVAVILMSVGLISLPIARAQNGAPGAAPGQAKPAPPAAAHEPSDPNVQPPTIQGIFSGLLDPFDYDPRGRRDPFGQAINDKPMTQGNLHGPLLPLQKFELNQLRLTGILWNVRNPKAMVIDPDGNTHIITQNTKIGPRNGYVASIREGEIVVVETIEQDGRLVSTAQVVKIAK